MLNDYNYPADEALLKELTERADWPQAFEVLSAPLHEALYQAQSFDLLDQLTHTERLILALDYVRMQVGQGGFIQLIQNGYAALVVTVIEAAKALGLAPEMRQTLDDALRVYVLNNEQLGRETTPKEFAALYEEFKEFEALDKAFEANLPYVLQSLISHVLKDC